MKRKKSKTDKKYFKSSNTLTENQAKFCRCALHVLALGIKNPYGICAASVKTSLGGRPCQYNFLSKSIPFSEVLAYARRHKSPRFSNRKLSKLNEKELRTHVSETYNARHK